jgi:hypothetical protein
VPFGTVVVSQTRIVSEIPRRSVFQVVSLLAPVQHVVDELVLVFIVGAPDQRLQSFLVCATTEAWRVGAAGWAAATASLRSGVF